MIAAPPSTISASESGAGRAPAPGSLELIRAFVNTADLESGQEDLATPLALAGWLAAHGLPLPGVGLGPDDLTEARAFREAVRDVLEDHAGHPIDPAAHARLDAIASGLRLRVRLGPVARLEAEGEGIDAAIGTMLAAVYESMVAGTWERLKVCRSSTCRWAFYDASRNRSGAWCSMAICGNRMKGRAFRGRKARVR